MGKTKKGLNFSKNFWIAVIAVCTFMTVLITISFIAFVNRSPEIVEKEESGGKVFLNYVSETNALTVVNAIPTTDAVGMKNSEAGQYFDFSVDVNVDGASKVEYEISVIKVRETSTIADGDIRIYLEKEDSGTYMRLFGPEPYKPMKNYTSVGSELGSMVLANVKKIKSGTDNYRLRIWKAETAAPGGDYSIEVDIHAVGK